MNKKESFSFDARALHQALTKRNITFKALPFRSLSLSVATHQASSSTKDACRFEMPQESQGPLPAPEVLGDVAPKRLDERRVLSAPRDPPPGLTRDEVGRLHFSPPGSAPGDKYSPSRSRGPGPERC